MTIPDSEVAAKSFLPSAKSVWKGITVLGELLPGGFLHPVTLELLGKARKLADPISARVSLLLIGNRLVENARTYFSFGADRVSIYDDPLLEKFDPENRASILRHFVENYPSTVMFFGNTSKADAVIKSFTGKEINVPDPVDIRSEADLSLIRTSFTNDPIRQTGFPYSCPLMASVREGIFSSMEPDNNRRGEIIICEIPAGSLSAV